MDGSKLIDLRDCQRPDYRRIYQDVERIQWEMHGLARWVFRAFGKAHKLKPIWSRQWEYPWAVLNADLRPGLVVLDAGCGASPLLPYLAWKWEGLSLYGADIGEDTEGPIRMKVRLLKAIGYVPIEGFYPNLDRRIHFRQESLERMSFSDDFFDRIFCISVMEHIAVGVQPQAMREMARVLRPGGKLVMTMDLPRGDPHAANYVVQASGLRLLGSLDYSVSRSIRHGHTYEVDGLILEKS